MMKFAKHLARQNGDTIVEVLIAVAIVGSVLTGAFAISNRSLSQVQMAQEQSEAQKIASSSVERLNGFVADNSSFLNNPNPTPDPFCITRPADRYVAVADSNVACTDATGRYTTSITTVQANTFQVTVNWDGFNGTAQVVTFTYHIKDPETI